MWVKSQGVTWTCGNWTLGLMRTMRNGASGVLTSAANIRERGWPNTFNGH